MKVTNNIKDIYSLEDETVLGPLAYYAIRKSDGTISCTAYIPYDKHYFVKKDDIVNINNERVEMYYRTIDPSSDIDECHKIYPNAIVMNELEEIYGASTHLEIEEGKITAIYVGDTRFDSNNITHTTEGAIMVKDESPGPEPTPPKPTASESSFDYDNLIGKVANKSIYSCRNTPIIVKGETVKLGNIVNAICQNKLLELIKVTI